MSAHGTSGCKDGTMRRIAKPIGKGQQGMALVITLLVMALLLLLGSAFLSISSTEIQIAFNERNGIQAFYLAEAGAERAIAELNLNSAYAGTGTTEPSLGTGTYAVTVTSVNPPPPGSFDRKQVTAFGYVPSSTAAGRAMARVEVVVQRGSSFNWAAFGQREVKFDKEGLVDSYDSSKGPYDASKAGVDGDLGSNGKIELQKETLVKGDAQAGEFVKNDGATITGSVTESAPPVKLEEVDTSYKEPNANATGISPPEVYDASKRDLFVDKNQTVTLAPGTYYLNEIKLEKEAKLVITGPVTIFMTGKLQADKEVVINTSQIPTNLFIYSSGDKIQMDKETKFYGAIYALKADIDIQKESSIYGSIIGYKVQFDKENQLHYDLALARQSSPNGKFRPVAGTWKEVFPSKN